MKSTEEFDCNGKEIFVGDYVINWWGSCEWEGERKEIFRVHDIRIIKKDNARIFALGNCYNKWEGKGVKKISKEEFKAMGIPLNTDYFQLKSGDYIKQTDQHFLGMSDEEFEKHLFDRQKAFDDIIFLADIK